MERHLRSYLNRVRFFCEIQFDTIQCMNQFLGDYCIQETHLLNEDPWISKSGLTYSLLHLTLVCLDLVLQFVDHFLHASLVLVVLLGLEHQLLEAAVLLAHCLLSLCESALFVRHLRLQFPHLWVCEN